MTVITRKLERETKGFNDIHDLTAEVAAEVEKSGLASGIVTVFVPGSTGGGYDCRVRAGSRQGSPRGP